MIICYIAHPIGGDVEANLADLRRIVRKINLRGDRGIVPFVPYYADVVSLDDNAPDERDRGLKNQIAILRSGVVNQLWLTGDRISAGMEDERRLALELGIEVRNFIGQL